MDQIYTQKRWGFDWIQQMKDAFNKKKQEITDAFNKKYEDAKKMFNDKLEKFEKNMCSMGIKKCWAGLMEKLNTATDEELRSMALNATQLLMNNSQHLGQSSSKFLEKLHNLTGMGWFKKSCSMKVEKKCNEKWRWHSRELKTWYMWDNITVSIFQKKDFSYFNSFSWYSHLNVWFWQFWPSPNMFKTCIEIVFCQYFLLQKIFYLR